MDVVSVFYAALGYLALVAAILGAMLFTEGDGGMATPHAVLIDGALLALIALLHGMVTQRILKDSPKRIVPQRLERATQAWLASLAVLAVFCGWRPAPQVLWSVSGTPAILLSVLFYAGWALALIGTFLTYHLDIFALTQAREHLETEPDRYQVPARGTPFLSGWLSHPCYAGILIGLWSTSVMTVGRLLLAAAATGYLLFDALSAAHRLDEPFRARHSRQFRAPPSDVPEHRDSGRGPITAKPAHHA
jgi:protein-S-isoprenylcysteine O-methyltransferase Ste14